MPDIALPHSLGMDLKPSSQKRPPGRNLGGHRYARGSGTTSNRLTAHLTFSFRMRSFPRTKFLTTCLKRNIPVGSSKSGSST